MTTARDGTPAEAANALETLCRGYWPAIYAYVRREGHGIEEARDLTQAFFVDFIKREHLSRLVHTRGRFRSFLLTFLKHFLSDERDKARAQKRGGDLHFLSVDEFTEEERHAFEPSERATPESVFERRWAEALLKRALDRLRGEYAREGRSTLFEALKDLQPGKHGEQSYATLGPQLGLSENGLKTAVHRMRQRHRQILREEIAHTVSRPEEIDEEIRHLLAVLAG
ncbi:MAG TPA: sigma-70 family RNA polymerase sigma factor [Candidatus Limnocylindria bacterium]|nr:sigma-70 family RNA polymerase sigma factor [Candidatus Limnocylindria bacterium]